MRLRYLIFLIIGFRFVLAQPNQVFIKNEGQWSGAFDYKLQMPDGAVFLKSDGVMVNLLDREALKYWHKAIHQHEKAEALPKEDMKGHAFNVKFIGAKKNAGSQGYRLSKTHYNYFLGSDSSKWRSGVKGVGEVLYEQVYPGVDVRYYFSHEGSLKYDFIVRPKADVSQIQLKYEGADSISIRNEALQIFTSVLTVTEEKPFVYQFINGRKDTVSCFYAINGDVVSFDIGDYDKSQTLIIDPELVFSSFIGSSSNNFGFTATYGANGELYGGGVVFNDGGTYPTTVGAFLTGHLGPRVDIAISKFSSGGSNLLYSTFIGGGEDELPYSLIERSDGSLVVYGSTGSANFPTTNTAYGQTFQGGDQQPSYLLDKVLFPNGSDVFICVLDANGGTLPASTYFGGSQNDGFNAFRPNYGDQFRGEVIVDSADNIYVVGNTTSIDMPTTPAAYKQVAPTGSNGFAAAFSSSLDQLLWATYIGGSDGDNAISAKLDPRQESVYIAGTTSSNNIIDNDSAYQPNIAGGTDGYVMRLDADNGAFIAGTYNGSPNQDANFFVDIDHSGDVYLFGQTRGAYPVSAMSDLYSVPNSAQFIHKLNADLSKSLISTVFGDGRHRLNNISPTAFMVDECKNVYLSGWGGSVNGAPYGTQGWTRNLPVTTDAFMDTSDGSDFYFLVLDATWKELRYATYFGDNGLDHVDGGTSRFSPDGTIYQAVCAGCFGNSLWPTTPGAYSKANYTYYGCNMAVTKLKFDLLEVRARASVNIDSGCVPFTVRFSEDSQNQDTIQWIGPQGNVLHPDSLNSILLDSSGIYTYQLVALDTNCGKSDTAAISIYAYEDDAHTDFTYAYDSCNNILKVDFINLSKNGAFYKWDFGDGKKSTVDNPTHYFVDAGTYDVRLINDNPFCGFSDTTHQEITLKKRVNTDEFIITQNPCDEGSLQLEAKGTDFQEYKWELGGAMVLYGKKVNYIVEKSGPYPISLTLSDTVCHRYFKADTIIDIMDAERYSPEVPNIFTPNGDGLNDYFQLPETSINEFWVSADIKVFNRWGTLLFHTNNFAQAWDGTFDGNKMSEGVYYYTVNLTNKCGVQKELKGFVHLMD